MSRIYVLSHVKIVLVAINSPSVPPPETANVDNNTEDLDATGGQPQAAPRLDWAMIGEIDTKASKAVINNLQIVRFIFMVFKFLNLNPSLLMNDANINYEFPRKRKLNL